MKWRVTRLLMEPKATMFLLHLTSCSPHSGTQLGNQSIHKFLFLGAGRSNAKLFAGLLQHGDGQLSQGAVLHVSAQLFFWHLRFGLLVSSSFIISCTIRENAYMGRTIRKVNSPKPERPCSPDLICVLGPVYALGCNWRGKPAP